MNKEYMRPQFVFECKKCGGDFEPSKNELLCPDCIYQRKSKKIRIKKLREGHKKYLERKEKAKRLRELNEKSKLIIFCSNCKEPFIIERKLQYVISGRCSKCRGWNYDKNLFNYFKGIIFSKNYKLSNFDKEIIRTRVRLFKIQHEALSVSKKEMTDETNRI